MQRDKVNFIDEFYILITKTQRIKGMKEKREVSCSENKTFEHLVFHRFLKSKILHLFIFKSHQNTKKKAVIRFYKKETKHKFINIIYSFIC